MVMLAMGSSLRHMNFLNWALKISILFTTDSTQVLEVRRNCHGGVNHWFHNLINFDVFHIET
jgi:hypothetical protein